MQTLNFSTSTLVYLRVWMHWAGAMSSIWILVRHTYWWFSLFTSSYSCLLVASKINKIEMNDNKIKKLLDASAKKDISLQICGIYTVINYKTDVLLWGDLLTDGTCTGEVGLGRKRDSASLCLNSDWVLTVLRSVRKSGNRSRTEERLVTRAASQLQYKEEARCF